jgi:hypothetical protein
MTTGLPAQEYIQGKPESRVPALETIHCIQVHVRLAITQQYSLGFHPASSKEFDGLPASQFI